MKRWLAAIAMSCAALFGGDASIAQNQITPYPAQRTPESCAAWARQNGLQGVASSLDRCLHGGQSGSGSSAPQNPQVAPPPAPPKAQTPPQPIGSAASPRATKCANMALELGMTGRAANNYVR